MTQVAEQPGSTAGRLGSVVLDCPDPLELAQFYSTLLGLEVDENGDDDWRSLTGAGSTLGLPALGGVRAGHVAGHRRARTPPGPDRRGSLPAAMPPWSPSGPNRSTRSTHHRPTTPRLADLRRPRGTPLQNLPRMSPPPSQIQSELPVNAKWRPST